MTTLLFLLPFALICAFFGLCSMKTNPALGRSLITAGAVAAAVILGVYIGAIAVTLTAGH